MHQGHTHMYMLVDVHLQMYKIRLKSSMRHCSRWLLWGGGRATVSGGRETPLLRMSSVLFEILFNMLGHGPFRKQKLTSNAKSTHVKNM